MRLRLTPQTDLGSPDYQRLLDFLAQTPHMNHHVQIHAKPLEIYLHGKVTEGFSEQLAAFPCIETKTPYSAPFPILGRHLETDHHTFHYNGVSFSQEDFHVFAGLCAVDTPFHVEQIMRALRDAGQVCTRMGAYKPRTSPYAFQGHGKDCLPYVFELAGKYGIKVIAMEVLEPRHIDEIANLLDKMGHPTGVMLQIGTRNCQNFSLLNAVGSQQQFPVLFKRGFGLSLFESLHAAEYIAKAGNTDIVFCLRGVKTQAGNPHRNLADFSQLPIVKRLTKMPVCVDPSHAVGHLISGPDGIFDAVHAAAQGVIAGANMLLVDCHPDASQALVDGHQALSLPDLPIFLEDMQAVFDQYQARMKRWSSQAAQTIDEASA